MHILNDFFLLNWGENPVSIEDASDKLSDKIYEIYDKKYDHFCDSCSILFIISNENLEKITKIKEFRELFSGLFNNQTIEKCLILQTQNIVLKFIIDMGDLNLNKTLKESFETLRKEGVITYYISRRLIGLFALIKKRKQKKEEFHLLVAKKDENFYRNSINILKTSILNLRESIQISTLEQKLEQIEQKLGKEKFSIGVTGIINAGKSTLLNALLGREVLGTAVIPETANLTILKYSKKEYAKVKFWNKKEFARIQESAKEIESIKKFVEETQKHFGKSLDKYIQEKSLIQDVTIDDLSLYTSVKKSHKKCNLIKSVELHSNLEFLQNGVEIVDTPGLDDPIIQREEITLQYVSECDLMIHLMNVSQSATQKDINFIIDSIVYQNIARLLIVITRIDMVTQVELDEVIAYTKKSIQDRLEELNQSYRYNSIIKKLEFIPVSGKMALFLRTNREELAKKEGYTLQKSGILDVERYLENLLFGAQSQKAKLIIESNKNELLSIIEKSKNRYKEEESYLNKTNLEIKKEYEKYHLEKNEIISQLTKVKKMIKEQERDLREYFKILHKYSHEKLLSIKEIIKIRVMDDVSYEIRKNKKIPKKQRVDHIVEIALKDGLVDLTREYRYEFEKRMKSSFDTITRALRFDFTDAKNAQFDSQAFFEKNFKTLRVFQNSSVLLEKIYKSITLYGKKSSQKLEIAIDGILQKDIDELQELLFQKMKNIDIELLNNFVDINKKRVQEIEDELVAKENLLEDSMKVIKDSSTNREERLLQIKNRKEMLGVIQKDLEVLHEAT